MMKQILRILTVLTLALLLTACRASSGIPSTQPADTSLPTEATIPDTTAAPAETTVPPETEAPTEPPVSERTVPYTQRIDRADQAVFDGPGYDYALLGTVRERGTYTIVEEALDHEGNLWGRLKSGIGWVDLTQIRSPEYAESLISAGYADEYLLLHSACHYFPCGETEYFSSIAFRAYGTLRDVEIFAYELTNDGFYPGEVLYTLDLWTMDMALVAELTFPGDMTTYGIRFTDESGVVHTFEIYISGRNGQVMLSEQK